MWVGGVIRFLKEREGGREGEGRKAGRVVFLLEGACRVELLRGKEHYLASVSDLGGRG